MLLEYFLSSGTPELSSDTKISSNASSVAPNQLVSGDSNSFKNALDESIVGRSKYLINQSDMNYSKSDLLDDIQSWDQLYSGEHPEQRSEADLLKTNIDNLILSEKNKAISESANFNDRFTTGEEVPVDGKLLPENTLLSNHVITNDELKTAVKEVVVSGEQKKNNIATSISDNKNVKNTEVKLALTPNTSTKDIPKESIVVTEKVSELAKQPAIEQVKDKASQSLNISAAGLKNPENSVKETNSNKKNTVTNLLNDANKIVASSKHATEHNNISNPKLATFENSMEKSPVSDKLLTDIKTGNSEINKSANENIQKTATALLNDEIKKAKTAGMFSAGLKEKHSLVKPLESNDVKSSQPALANQSQTIASSATIVPESLKLEQPNQIGKQQQKLDIKDINGNPLTEQFIKQAVKNENLSSSLTNTDTTSQNTSRATSATYGAESISPQTQQTQQQLNSNQTISRHNEVALPVSVPTPQWNKKFAEHVSMLALKGTTSAQIKLDPPELGPLAVRIVHTGSETQVQFQVSNPIARELVDSGMNKLREMLEEHGFENVDVDVSEQQTNEQHASEETSELHDVDDKIDGLNQNSNELPEKIINNSLVDLFA